MWSDRVYGWPLDELQVAERREVEAEVLESVGGLVDKEHVQRDVEAMDLDVRLSVDWVGEACR